MSLKILQHFTSFLKHIVVTLCFVILTSDIKCLCKQSVYIQPTFSTVKPKSRIHGELYPRMVIFRMDRTIWPFCFELDVTRPIKNKNGVILDDGFQPLKPFKQIPELLESLHRKGYKLAFINQSPDNSSTENLLQWFDLNKFLTFKITMNAPRKELIRLVSQTFSIDFGDLLYLDAEYDEIPDIAELGTVCIQSGDRGVTAEDVEKGLSVFSTEAPPA